MSNDETVAITDELVAGKLFTIKSRLGRYIEHAGCTESHWPRYDWVCEDGRGRIGECLFTRKDKRIPGRNLQLFHLFRLSDYHVALVPFETAIVVDYYFGNMQWAKPMGGYGPHGGHNQQFSMIRPPGQTGVMLQCRHGDEMMSVWRNDGAEDNWIVGWGRKNPIENDQLFDVTAEGSVPLRPLRKPAGGVLTLGTDAVRRVRALDEQMPEEMPESGPMLIGESYLPFFAVYDPELPGGQQHKASPYYILRREQLWRKIGDERLGPGRTREIVTEVGVTQEHVRSLEGTLGINIAPGVDVTYKAVTAALGGKLDAELKFSDKLTQVFTEKRTDTYTIKELPHTQRAIVWRLEDRFTLERMNGTTVRTWKSIVDRRIAEDVYVAR